MVALAVEGQSHGQGGWAIDEAESQRAVLRLRAAVAGGGAGRSAAGEQAGPVLMAVRERGLVRLFAGGAWQAPQDFLSERVLPDGDRIAAEGRRLAFGYGPQFLFCPHYHQPWFPEDDISKCYRWLMTSPDLVQDGWANPYVIAAERVRELDDSRTERWRTALATAAYAALNRDAGPEDIAWTGLMRQRYVRGDVAATVAVRLATRLLPRELTQVTAVPSEAAVDLRVQTRATYRSAASPRQLLAAAARRGLKAVAIADKNTTFGWQEAELDAEELKRQGLLPPDFQVIPAQTVETGAGPVVVLFVRSRLPDGMTAAEVIREAHEQGGVALLAYPAEPGRRRALRRLDFDGYLFQLRPFDLWRTVRLMGDPALAGVPGLYASSSTVAEAAGLPYSTVLAPPQAEAMAAAMREGNAYASSPLPLPLIKVVTSGAVASVERLVGRYFDAEDLALEWLAARLGADFVGVRTSWDDNVRAMMDLLRLPAELRDLADGSSDLLRRPRVLGADAEWGLVRVRYRRHPTRVFLQMALTW